MKDNNCPGSYIRKKKGNVHTDPALERESWETKRWENRGDS